MYLFIIGARFINLQLSSLVDKWYGESQKRAEAVFSLVNFFCLAYFALKSKNLPLIMVFLRNFLYWGRQKNYFHVKILILVCPNRTCKNFENQ